MPSTFSPALRIELIASGSQTGVWGNTTNNNLGDLVEQAITGATEINVTGADVTLTALNGVVDQARSAVLVITGTPGVTRIITIPNANKSYTVKNRSNATVQIKTSGGTAFDVPTLSESYLYCDGDNVISGRVITDGANAVTSLASPFNSPAFTGTPTAPTASTGTNTTQVATTAFVNAEIAADTANLAPLNSPALTGVPTAPTASTATNTTQLATTAYVVARVAQDAATKTGVGATGTWNINVTGNAATATNATNATNASNAVTQAPGTNNTTIATTAFVQAATAVAIPSGVIVMWSGSIASIPAGFLLCNGASGTPDLRDRFVVGAGSTYSPGNTGGADTVTLTTAQLPSHTHSISGSGNTGNNNVGHNHTFSGDTGNNNVNHSHAVSDPGHNHAYTQAAAISPGAAGSLGGGDGNLNTSISINIPNRFTGITLGLNNANHLHAFSGTTANNSANHVHPFSFSGTSGATGSGAAHENRPPFFALAYIMKT